MISESLQELVVRPSSTIREAISSIERGTAAIVLVVDDSGLLLGVVTDGDIRRELLRGATLESGIGPFYNRNFRVVSPSARRAEVLEIMRAHGIQQIPIVDENSRLLGLHLLREIIGASERSNWAVLMAGGRGTRLDPITQSLPKPMLSVAGRPIIERLTLHLVGFGFRRIFLSVCHLGHLIEQHFGDGSAFGCRIEYLRENKPLGTGGCLSLLPEMPENPIVVMNGDLVTDVDIAQLLLFHEEGHQSITICTREYTHTVPFGVIEARDGHVLRITEKPTFGWLANAGVYVLNPELVARVPKNQEFKMTDIVDGAIARGEKVGTFPIDREWMDVGEVEHLKRARGIGV
jgi:dTDP-glucose pyrophosphorylase